MAANNPLFDFSQPRVMAILNVTPDSFFAGSRMPDAPHVRAAEAYFRYAPENKKEELARRILMKARKFGVNIQSPTILEWAQEKSGR